MALAKDLIDHQAGQAPLDLGNDEPRAGGYRRAAAKQEPAEIGYGRQVAAHAGQAQEPFLGARNGRDAGKGNDFFNLVDSAGQIVIAQSENNAVPVADLMLTCGLADMVLQAALFVLGKPVNQRKPVWVCNTLRLDV